MLRRITSKELKACFWECQLTLNNGVYGRIATRKPLLSKKKIVAYLQFLKYHVNNPENYWDSVSKYNFLASMQNVTFDKRQPLHSSIKNFFHLWNMVLAASWYGPPDQDSLLSLMELWILNSTSKFHRKMSGYLSVNWSSRENGHVVNVREQSKTHKSYEQKVVKSEKS